MSHEAAGEVSRATPLSSYRWYALAVLFLVSVLNTFDKMLIPALAEPLRQEFGFSDSQLGFLIGIVFSAAYSIAAIPIGLMIDRVNRTRLLAVLLIVWSFMTLLSARTSSFFGLALCRVGVAAAESGGNPTSLSLIGDYFPKEQRGKAVGIFSANTALAGLLVFSVAGYVASEYGWRTMFVIAALPGLLLGVLVLLTLREPPRGVFDADDTPAGEDKAGFVDVVREIVANRTLLWVTLGGVLVIMGLSGVTAFKTTFFVRFHEMSLTQAGLATGFILAPASALGTIMGGFFADRALRHSAGGGCRFVAMTALATIPFGVAAFLVPNTSASVVLMFCYQALGMCFYAATLSTIMGLAPIRIRGSVITYILLILNLGGYGFGPQVIGVFSDLIGWGGVEESLRWGMVCGTALLLVAATCYLIAARRLDSAPAARDTGAAPFGDVEPV